MDSAVFAFQAVRPRPGRADAPVAGATGRAGARPRAVARRRRPAGGACSMLFPLLLVGMLVFIFWSSRSQQKKQDAASPQLKKGDRVVTRAASSGDSSRSSRRYAKVEIAPGVKVQILRTSLARARRGRRAAEEGQGEPASEKKT